MKRDCERCRYWQNLALNLAALVGVILAITLVRILADVPAAQLMCGAGQ